jgi:hypothetical protein
MRDVSLRRNSGSVNFLKSANWQIGVGEEAEGGERE